ncbi:MAG: conjugal transfer protein [Defluviitaleaceae bacterium]|nr:conjugal transfer protein [Defluviitaleaceae bacterium]
MPDLLKFSMQLAMIKQLLNKELISEKEYNLLKLRLMKDYKIPVIATVKSK